MSRAEILDPVIVAELERLDAALAGDPCGDEELERLVRDVRALAPRPSHEFRVSLDERAAQGFARPARRRRRLRLPPLVPALGAVAAVVAAIVVVGVALHGGGGSNSASVSGSGGGATLESGAAVRKQPAPAAQSLATPTPAAPGAARKVERAAALTLTPAPGDVQDVADRAVRATQDLGGYVETSQVSTGGSGASADMRLRIPSAHLDDLVARLSALAHVGALTQASTDITGPTDSTAARLSDARHERSALLRALGRATTAAEIASLRERLRLNRSRIAELKGELNALRRRAAYATIELTITGTRRRPTAGGGGSWTPKDALHDALRVLEVAAGVLLIALAALVPVVLLAAAGAVAARMLRRRRREAALDAG